MLDGLKRGISKRTRHWGPSWRYLHNRAAVRAFAAAPSALTEAEARIVGELARRGLARSEQRELLGVESRLEALTTAVAELDRRLEPPLAELRRRAREPEAPGSKRFLHMYLGDEPELDTESVFARYAAHPSFVRIADHYFGLHTELRYYNVWRALASDLPPTASQLWHRDREDHLLLKVFVYLDDVGPGQGPLCYAPGTHARGKVRARAAARLEAGVERSSDADIAALVPPREWITATGVRGDIVFADTRGYHKGGLARDGERLLFTFMYTSPACQRHYFRNRRAVAPPADPVLRRVLGF